MKRQGAILGWSSAAAIAAAVGASIAGNAAASLAVLSGPSVTFWILFLLAPACLLVSAAAGARMLSERAAGRLSYLLTGSLWVAVSGFWFMTALVGSSGPVAEAVFLLLVVLVPLSVVCAVVSAIVVGTRSSRRHPVV